MFPLSLSSSSSSSTSSLEAALVASCDNQAVPVVSCDIIRLFPLYHVIIRPCLLCHDNQVVLRDNQAVPIVLCDNQAVPVVSCDNQAVPVVM